jgi:hypothetical protein
MTEAELCAAFIAVATKKGEWRAYPETAGFDILLVRVEDGVQIGIEAKCALNNKVVLQALPDRHESYWQTGGPDYRAVLVPASKLQAGLQEICGRLGVTVIAWREADGSAYSRASFSPCLPGDRFLSDPYWHEWCPVERCPVPDYVPDVAAGVPSPLTLTAWKIKAIRLAILLESRPVTRADFKALQLDPRRWVDPWAEWLRPTPEGYVPGARMPDLKAQHPVNYEQIKADRAKWDLSFSALFGEAAE